MSMVPAVNLGLLRPETVVSLNHVPGARITSRIEADTLRIGAMVRHARIVADPLIRAHVPLLADSAVIGDVQIRHRGTLGGSVAHADPAADYLPVLVALDASIVVASADRERADTARDFFLDVMMTALGPDEIHRPRSRAEAARAAPVRPTCGSPGSRAASRS